MIHVVIEIKDDVARRDTEISIDWGEKDGGSIHERKRREVLRAILHHGSAPGTVKQCMASLTWKARARSIIDQDIRKSGDPP